MCFGRQNEGSKQGWNRGGPCWDRTSDQWIKSLPRIATLINSLPVDRLPKRFPFYYVPRGFQPKR